jgi:hypothetical protein
MNLSLMQTFLETIKFVCDFEIDALACEMKMVSGIPRNPAFGALDALHEHPRRHRP